MSKKFVILGSLLLLLLCSCVDNERVIEELPPMEEINPLPELGQVPSISNKPLIKDVISNKQPQIEFDESVIMSLQEYFKLLGHDSIPIHLTSSSSNRSIVELGVNPKVELNVYNQNSISVRTHYSYSTDEYVVYYTCLNTQKNCKVNIVSSDEISFEYDGTTNTKLFTTVEEDSFYQGNKALQFVFEESLKAFQMEKDSNVVLDVNHLSIIQQMLMSSYYVQDIFIEDSVLEEIQPLLLQSQLFDFPISYIHTGSSLWVIGDITLHIFVDAYNRVNGTYYVSEVVPVEYEYSGQWIIRDVSLICDKGMFSVAIDGISSFHYGYDGYDLLLNGNEYFSQTEEQLFVESILPKMEEFYFKYDSKCIELEQLITEIQGVLKN